MPNEPQVQSPRRFDPGGCASLYGCAGQHSETALQQAGADFQKVKEDSNVLRIAPKDVIRAGESLARADRLSSYWGSGSDVVHYAYLSQRYSEIAREHTNQALNEERAAKLELERQRLQLACANRNCSACSSKANGSKNRSSH
jgi:hypothetical protein